MIARLRRARRHEVADLNITAFMNLMVALVPFLLITAVFTQIAIKELNLPDTSQPPPPADMPQKGLAVIVRENSLTLTDAGKPLRSWPRLDGEHDYAALAQRLAEIKNRDPGEDRISLLLEPGIPYDILIRVMDTVHYLPAVGEGSLLDMYPQISVGDAPAVAAP